MIRRPKSLNNSTGFVLTELLMVVVIIAILAAIAAPSFRSVIQGQRIRSASSDLYASLALARSEAIKRNREVSISAVGGDWTNGWEVPNPTVVNTFIDQHAAVQGVSINSGSTTSVVFESSGRVKPGGADVTFTISGSTAWGQRCVYLALSGRPAVKSC